MPSKPISASSIQLLRTWFRGQLVSPQDPDHLLTIDMCNRSSVRLAGLVAYPTDEQDVSTAVLWAKDDAIELAVCTKAEEDMRLDRIDGGLVIDLSRHLNTISIDALARVATVGGGARWSQVQGEAIRFGLATTSGTHGEDGVGGLALGGGIGLLQGTCGLTIDNILGVRVVIASGAVIEASEDSNPDLFWALRGGGGSFGVVTSFRFRLHPQRPTVAFSLGFHPVGEFPRIIGLIAQRHKTRDPTEGLLVCLSRDQGGEPKVLLGCFFNGPLDEAQTKFGDLMSTSTDVTTMRDISYRDLNAPDGTSRTMEYSTTAILSTLDVPLAMRLYSRWKQVRKGLQPGVPTPFISFSLLSWHAPSLIHPNATPWFHRGRDQIILHIGCVFDLPDQLPFVRILVNSFRDLVGPPSSTPAFVSLESDGLKERLEATFGEENLRRLRQVKRRYDPMVVFGKEFGEEEEE